MFNLFKKVMYAEESNPKDNKTLPHRILKTNIEKELDSNEDELIFGCGCFWGAEKCFWKLPGVVTTSVGYAGGKKNNPNYNEVCSGLTGHTEVVRVVWNVNEIHVSDLLKMFWESHNPTQKNRQGNDIGTQYRSAIYYKSEKNISIINSSREAYQSELIKNNYGLITTEIKKIDTYYHAEQYHQQYLASEGSRQYCSAAPTGVSLGNFNGSDYKLPYYVWENFDWSIDKCVLRSNNKPIKINI